MYKKLVGVLLLVLAINGISSYYIVNHINDSVAAVRWQSIGQSQKASTDLERVEQSLSSRTTRMTSLVGNLTSDFRAYQETDSVDKAELASDIETLEEVQDSYTSFSAKIVEGQEILVRRASTLEEEAMSVLELLREFNDELTVFNERVTAVENRIALPPNSLMESLYGEGWELDEDLANLEPCPIAPINRADQLPPLRRAMENSRATGVHNVIVTFDVETDGSTVLKDAESATAPSRLIRAVNRYITGLKFSERDTLLSNCEMVVKLDIGTQSF